MRVIGSLNVPLIAITQLYGRPVQLQSDRFIFVLYISTTDLYWGSNSKHGDWIPRKSRI